MFKERLLFPKEILNHIAKHLKIGYRQNND